MDLSFIGFVLAIYYTILTTLVSAVWIYATLRSVGQNQPKYATSSATSASPVQEL